MIGFNDEVGDGLFLDMFTCLMSGVHKLSRYTEIFREMEMDFIILTPFLTLSGEKERND